MAADEQEIEHWQMALSLKEVGEALNSSQSHDAGISDFHFHALQHIFATRLRAATVHEYDIDNLLGHSTRTGDTRKAKVTRGYAHGCPAEY